MLEYHDKVSITFYFLDQPFCGHSSANTPDESFEITELDQWLNDLQGDKVANMLHGIPGNAIFEA